MPSRPHGFRVSGEARAAIAGGLIALMLILFVAIRLDAAGSSAPSSAPNSAGGSAGSRLTPVSTTVAHGFWVVRRGQTFAVIARATGLSVVEIERFNPHQAPASLTVGEHVALRPAG